MNNKNQTPKDKFMETFKNKANSQDLKDMWNFFYNCIHANNNNNYHCKICLICLGNDMPNGIICPICNVSYCDNCLEIKCTHCNESLEEYFSEKKIKN